jgi:hypothetical protein
MGILDQLGFRLSRSKSLSLRSYQILYSSDISDDPDKSLSAQSIVEQEFR